MSEKIHDTEEAAARRALEMVSQDEIDWFRVLRLAGRSNMEKARAVVETIRSVNPVQFRTDKEQP